MEEFVIDKENVSAEMISNVDDLNKQAWKVHIT